MASGDDRLRAQDRTVSRIASVAPESAAGGARRQTCRNHAGLRRQRARLDRLWPLRPEYRQDRAPARRRRQRQRQSDRHQGPEGSLRTRAAGVRTALCARQARPGRRPWRRRRRDRRRCVARQPVSRAKSTAPKPSFHQIKTRRRGVVRARNAAQDLYLPALKQQRTGVRRGTRPAPARPGSPSATRFRCSNRAWSSG